VHRGSSEAEGVSNVIVKCFSLIFVPFDSVVDDINEIFGVGMGLLLKMSEIIIGACIFVIAKVDTDSVTFYFYVAVLAVTNFIPCFFGGEMLETTERYLYDIFTSDWLEANLKYKKLLITFMENLKRPIAVRFAGYEKINLERFTEVRHMTSQFVTNFGKYSFFCTANGSGLLHVLGLSEALWWW
jgi:hypothetical protein